MLDSNLPSVPRRDPWNKGRLIGQKRPLKPKDVWSIRVRLQVERRARNLALFNLAIDSKLRGCDLVRLQVDDVSVGGRVRDRATIVQKKTGRPVQFEITEQTRTAIQAWLANIRSRSTRREWCNGHKSNKWTPFNHAEGRLGGRERHVVGNYGLSEALEGECANLFGCDASL